jgi:long-chain acyl-CoA synthetase
MRDPRRPLLHHNFPKDTFSVPVSAPSADTSAIRRDPKFVSGLLETWDPEVRTVWDALLKAVRLAPRANFHGVRQLDPKTGVARGFTWSTYEQVFRRIRAFGSGLRALGLLQPDYEQKITLLGIMGVNAPEWSIAEYGAMGFSASLVPIYTTTPVPVLVHVLNECAVATVVCDAACAKLLLQAKPEVAALRSLVIFGKCDPDLARGVEGVTVYTFDQVEAKGAERLLDPSPPHAQAVYSFGFTSGSTGNPKAAMITHRAQISSIAASMEMLDTGEFKNFVFMRPRTEVHLSYLPMAHAMERTFQTVIISAYGAIGFFQGKRELILDDIKALRPTIFPTVPRLMNQMQDRIVAQLEKGGGIQAAVFKRGLRVKLAALKARGVYQNALWDALIFKSIRKAVGLDRVTAILTGSAPISGGVLEFFRVVFGCIVSEGYGSTEMTCACTTTAIMHAGTEHVGGPIANCEIRLQSVPEMNYLASDTKHGKLDVQGRGEICVRGPLLMSQYYRSPDATAKCIDADGFYHSGDVGAFLMDGSLKVFDRVRNIFKLSIGEYVAPEKVEGVLLRAPLIMNAYVHGDAFHPKLVAIIVPDPGPASAWAKKHDKKAHDVAALCLDSAFLKAVEEDMVKACKENGLQSFEVPKALALVPEPFAVGDVLTPTFKLQRAKAKEKWGAKLEELLGPRA